MDVVEHGLGVEALCVRLHARHQVRPHQAVGIARPVVDLGGGHQLAAHGHAGDHDRLEVGARGIHGGGPAGGARAEDQEAGVLGRSHRDPMESVMRGSKDPRPMHSLEAGSPWHKARM